MPNINCLTIAFVIVIILIGTSAMTFGNMHITRKKNHCSFYRNQII